MGTSLYPKFCRPTAWRRAALALREEVYSHGRQRLWRIGPLRNEKSWRPAPARSQGHHQRNVAHPEDQQSHNIKFTTALKETSAEWPPRDPWSGGRCPMINRDKMLTRTNAPLCHRIRSHARLAKSPPCAVVGALERLPAVGYHTDWQAVSCQRRR